MTGHRGPCQPLRGWNRASAGLMNGGSGRRSFGCPRKRVEQSVSSRASSHPGRRPPATSGAKPAIVRALSSASRRRSWSRHRLSPGTHWSSSP